MTNEQLRAHNKNRKIQQIAWLTSNLEASMKAWVEILGIGPWNVYTFTDETVQDLRVGGKLVDEPFKFLIGITHVGDMELELIEPVYGPMIYQEYLQSKGPGLHHIKEQISEHDFENVLADYAGKGIAVTQTGQFVRDFHFYLDTAPRLDFIYELGNCPVQDLPPDMVTVYPPEK